MGTSDSDGGCATTPLEINVVRGFVWCVSRFTMLQLYDLQYPPALPFPCNPDVKCVADGRAGWGPRAMCDEQ